MTTTPTASVAELRRVTKRFGATVALDAVDVVARQGKTHGLIGRNGAGKSTIVGVLTGLHRADSGTLTFGGQHPPYGSPQQWKRHVACVYQHPMLVPDLSVAENLLLGRMPHRRGRIDWKQVRLRADAILQEWGIHIPSRLPASDLDVEQSQLLEIAKALSHGAELIVLDEPTARLDATAAERLFANMRRLQKSGATFLLISHYLHEVFDVCDEVTVLRDGKRTGTHHIRDVTKAQLVEEMIGDSPPATLTAPPTLTTTSTTVKKPPRLTVTGFSGPLFHDLDLTAGAGEILGVAGLVSSGRSQIGEALGGLEPATGDMRLDGKPVPLGHVDRALAAGIALVPRDRHRAGLIEHLPVQDNITLAEGHLRPGPCGTVLPRRRRALAQALIARLQVSPPRTDLPAHALSGGNQQKLVLARALATNPKLLVTVEPTAGVDIASKSVLLTTLTHAAEAGTTIIICSDDLDDLRICHRVAVIRDGRRTTELAAGWDDRTLVSEIEGT